MERFTDRTVLFFLHRKGTVWPLCGSIDISQPMHECWKPSVRLNRMFKLPAFLHQNQTKPVCISSYIILHQSRTFSMHACLIWCCSPAVRLAARGEGVHVGFDWSIIHQCAPGTVLSNPGATTEQMYRAGWLLPIERGDAEQDSVLFSGLGNKPHAVSLVSWLYGWFSPMTWDTMGDCVNIEGWN